MDTPPTLENMETLVEQLAICVAGVRISPEENIWDDGAYICLPLALNSGEPNSATNARITNNAYLTRPGNIHAKITDETKSKETLCLNKVQEGLWLAFYTQEVASEVGINILAGAVDEQYLVELNKMFVGYKNQTPLTVIDHLYNQWVKVTNAE